MKYIQIFFCVIHISALGQTGTDSVKLSDEARALSHVPKVYLSIDQGVNWLPADRGLPNDVRINTWISTDGIVVAGTDMHGIFISVDHLKSWYPSSKGLPRNVRILSLISSGNFLFAGTYQNGLFYSDDRGETWRSAGRGLGNSNIRCLYYFRHTLFAGTDAGLYRSVDEGNSWLMAAARLQINGFSSARNELFVSTNEGVIKSADSGENWDFIFDDDAVYTLSAHQQDIYARSFNGDVYRSRNSSNFVWIKAHLYFPFKYTFRITPAGEQFFTADWNRSIRGISDVNGLYRANGIPENVQVTQLLDTPYGLLAGIGNPGC